MSSSHNKKRNSIFLYECLVRRISQALVEGDQRMSSRVLKVLKNRFKPGSELYREFRLANSLVKTSVSSPAVAALIIQEARAAAKSHDVNKLESEKTSLIHDINACLGGRDLLDTQVNEYRIYATIQTLLNDWRSRDPDLGRLAHYEDQLVQWLVSEKTARNDGSVSDLSPGSGRLLMKIMTQKLNERYSGVLTQEQKSFIRTYALSTTRGDDLSFRNRLIGLRDELIEKIDEYVSLHTDEKYTNERLVEVRNKLLSESYDAVDDASIAQALLYIKLRDELTHGADLASSAIFKQ